MRYTSVPCLLKKDKKLKRFPFKKMVKQVIILRGDIEMSTGKLVSQGAHASLKAALKVKEKKPKVFKTWEKEGEKKVVLRANLDKIKEIKEKADELGIIKSLIRDKGLTEIEPGTRTALALGPGKEEKVNELTSSLPLL